MASAATPDPSPKTTQPASVATAPALTLGEILDSDEILLDTGIPEPIEEDEPEAPTEPKDGYCIECEDQAAEVLCETCTDVFCEVCFSAQHRKGSRKRHVFRALASTSKKASTSRTPYDPSNGTDDKMDIEDAVAHAEPETDRPLTDERMRLIGERPETGEDVGDWYIERAKYVPMRLTLPERKLLRLLEAALEVSEYTDRIDILSYTSKPKRIVQQIKELCSILSGLVIAADYKLGQQLFAERDFESNEEFYQTVFELGRRHKILNPDKMRTTYGKLMYMLMDSQAPEVQDMLGFSCVKPIHTVYDLLKSHDVLALLQDERISIATKEIISEGRPRHEIQREIKLKERAIEFLSVKYSKGKTIDQEAIKQCLYSIGDNASFLRVNRDPCDKMIGLLKQYFHPTSPGKSGHENLAIRTGRGGARLSHDHAKQYNYVLQSLSLWREVLHDMFRLWSIAEGDLLTSTSPYRLRDTGQGLQRVQQAPKTARMMQLILQRAQKSIGYWVGSSVIHMGDHNVPNAFMFIDKYGQISRILYPLCTVISMIPELVKKPALKKYIDAEFGEVDALIREILGDFFRHGFDGSGADNGYDAGSCIDGRLTSAWNWCSSLEKKRYFPVFLLTGFTGFDGAW